MASTSVEEPNKERLLQCLCCHVSWRDILLQWLPCFSYVILYVILDVLIASQGYVNEITDKRQFSYTPGVLILLSESGKFCVSFLLLVAQKVRENCIARNRDYNYAILTDLEPSVSTSASTSAATGTTTGASTSAAAGAAASAQKSSMTLAQGLSYFVPATLYTLWNVINYQSLLHVSLSMYSILYQSVVFFTAFLWSITFNRKLTAVQWLALVILGVGVFVVHVKPDFEFHIDWSAMWVFSQAFVSAFGSVMNEFLYKRVGSPKVSINEQNSYLYGFSIITTSSYLLISEGPRIFLPSNFFRGFTTAVVVIVCLSVMIGLSVSMILKHCNIIIKLYAQAVHSPMEVIAAHFVLGTELTPMIAIASVLICLSTYLYYRPPVKVPAKYLTDDQNAKTPVITENTRPESIWDRKHLRKR